jgi:hypothetical protein
MMEDDEVFVSIATMRVIVARLLAHEAARYDDPNDLFRAMSDGLEAQFARVAEKSGNQIDLEEKMKTEMEWFFAAARSVL